MISRIKIKGTIPLMLAALLVLGTSTSWAAITTCGDGSNGMGTALPNENCLGNTVHNNDREQAVLNIINASLLGGITPLTDLTLLGKSDDSHPFGTLPTGGTGTNSGTWDTGLVPVSFISIKAGHLTIKVYDVMGATSGFWDTLGILNGGGQRPNLGHISYWSDPANPPAAVPIPGAALLFGTGLIGLIAIARRKALKTKN